MAKKNMGGASAFDEDMSDEELSQLRGGETHASNLESGDGTRVSQEEGAPKSRTESLADEIEDDPDGDDSQDADQFADQAGDQAGDQADDQSQQEEDGEGEETQEQRRARLFAQFQEKHKGKSPEDLMDMAFNLNRAMSEARGEAKKAKHKSAQEVAEAQQILQNVTATLEARAAERQARIAQENAQFEANLQSDPDGVVRQTHQQAQQARVAAEAQQDAQQFFQAQRLAAEALIPGDFDEAYNGLLDFGHKVAGFSEKDVMQVADHRAINVLDMAKRFNDLITSGFVDRSGNVLNRPQSANQAGNQASNQPDDPRASLQRIARANQVAGKNTLTNKGQRGNQSPMQLLRDKANAILESDDFTDDHEAAAKNEKAVRGMLRKMDQELQDGEPTFY